MSATDELRKLLDERGVEWKSEDCLGIDGKVVYRYTCWGDGGSCYYCEPFGAEPGTLAATCDFSAIGVTPEQAIAATLGTPVTGETSDGYHTFNELYHHRAVLFSVIVRDHIDRAWKSKAHHDGTMYDGMFIVGIETPQGQATYHYDIDPYWDMFDCQELGRAPEWDGHTPDDAIERIATLGAGTC